MLYWRTKTGRVYKAALRAFKRFHGYDYGDSTVRHLRDEDTNWMYGYMVGRRARK